MGFGDDRRRGGGPQPQPLVQLCACGAEARHARIVPSTQGKRPSQPFFTLEDGFVVVAHGVRAGEITAGDCYRARAEIEQLELPSTGPAGECLRDANKKSGGAA